jgi:hypothetical protein
MNLSIKTQTPAGFSMIVMGARRPRAAGATSICWKSFIEWFLTKETDLIIKPDSFYT